MSFSSVFIRRPVATTLIGLGLVFAGLVAFRLLPVSPLPQVDFPTITVFSTLPGASPETMATSVAMPLERELGHIASVNEMTSSSTLGTTRITLQFDLDRNIDGAARDVEAAINAARALLPPNLPSNPTYRKVNPADAPIMILSLTSETLNRGQMYDAASTLLAQKLSQIRGVGQVTVGGSSLPAVRVEVNSDALNKYGIGFESLRTAIASSNINRPKGNLEEGGRYWQIQANDQMKKAGEYLPLIVSYRNNMPVRLSDLAQVDDSVQDLRNAGIADGKPAVLVIVSRQPGANIIETVDLVRAMLPTLRAAIPAAINLNIVMDRTPTIRSSLHDMELTLSISVLLVVLVVFLFLRDARTTLIPAVAVPISLIATFAFMYLMGYSLDNLSLMALIIATGFVVDDAIVVLENISRHVDSGKPPFEAALIGAKEVGFTVLSMSLSLIAVFIPILLMGGIIGRLFREFSVTLSIAILVSLLVSLTITPAMAARLAVPESARKPGRVTRFSGKAFDWLISRYRASLGLALSRPGIVLAVLFATIGLNVYLYAIVPKGFFPQQDTGKLIGSIQADQSISFQAMRNKLADFVEIVRKDPAVQHVVGFTGGGQINSGFMFIVLKPVSVRRINADEVIARLRGKLAREPGARLYLQSIQDIRIGGRPSNSQYQYTLQGDDLGELAAWTPRIERALSRRQELLDVNTDQQDRGLETRLLIDRQTAARLGVTPALIDAALQDAFGQRLISVIYSQLNQYFVVLEAAPKYWQNPESLKDVYVTSATGQEVPLPAISRFETKMTSLAVNHQGPFVASTVSFNLPESESLSDAVRIIGDTMTELRVPVSIHGGFQSTAKAFQSSLSNQIWLILAAILAIYIVLGMLYESYMHPLTILSTLPSAGVGALLAILAFKIQFTVITLIGVFLLIGIVKKNAIMMIDFALAAEREGMNTEEAIHHAAVLRFRPIMMTTAAALLGALPLALVSGEGSELRRPLGIAIVGGLLVSQLLTLYTVPVIYLYLDRLRLKWSRAGKKPILGDAA